MIQANELRLGNWINKHFENNQGEYELVTSRTIFDCQANPTGKFTYTGIELSPEILDNINWGGYVKFNIGSYFKIDDVGHLYYCNDYSGINIDNVHQLQNLYFALTGKELNVQLSEPKIE